MKILWIWLSNINLNFAHFISRLHLNWYDCILVDMTSKSKQLAMINDKYKKRAWFRNRAHTFGKITSVDWQLVAPHYPLRFRKKAFLIPSASPSRRRSADTCPQVIGTAARYDARRCVRKKMRRWTRAESSRRRSAWKKEKRKKEGRRHTIAAVVDSREWRSREIGG